MARDEGLPAPRTLRRLMLVAATYDEKTFDALGITAAYELILYTIETPEPDLAQKLVDSDALIDGKPISEHSSTTLREARKELTAPKEPESTAKRTARALERALEARGADPIHVQHRNRNGHWVIDVRLDLHEAMLLAK